MSPRFKANEVDVETANTVVGPLLNIDAKKKIFTGSDATIMAAANKCPLLKREGRGAFKLPAK